jgi:hypothetical protein
MLKITIFSTAAAWSSDADGTQIKNTGDHLTMVSRTENFKDVLKTTNPNFNK